MLNTKKTNIEGKLLNNLFLKSIKLLLTLLFYLRKSILRKISTLLLLFILLFNIIEQQSINKQLFSRKRLFRIDRTKTIIRKMLILFLVKDKRKHKHYNILITYT